jgi:hypothetical protein
MSLIANCSMTGSGSMRRVLKMLSLGVRLETTCSSSFEHLEIGDLLTKKIRKDLGIPPLKS